jgi:hypothetical protein
LLPIIRYCTYSTIFRSSVASVPGDLPKSMSNKSQFSTSSVNVSLWNCLARPPPSGSACVCSDCARARRLQPSLPAPLFFCVPPPISRPSGRSLWASLVRRIPVVFPFPVRCPFPFSPFFRARPFLPSLLLSLFLLPPLPLLTLTHSLSFGPDFHLVDIPTLRSCHSLVHNVCCFKLSRTGGYHYWDFLIRAGPMSSLHRQSAGRANPSQK